MLFGPTNILESSEDVNNSRIVGLRKKVVQFFKGNKRNVCVIDHYLSLFIQQLLQDNHYRYLTFQSCLC